MMPIIHYRVWAVLTFLYTLPTAIQLSRPCYREVMQRSLLQRLQGGRPPFDHVLMFKILVLQSMHSLSDERCEALTFKLRSCADLGKAISNLLLDAHQNAIQTDGIWNWKGCFLGVRRFEEYRARVRVVTERERADIVILLSRRLGDR